MGSGKLGRTFNRLFCEIKKMKMANKITKEEICKLLIKELEKHIEHPTKPGYKRHDILKRIEELKQNKL